MSVCDENQSNSCGTHLAERRRRTRSVPNRKTRETIYAAKLIESIRKIRREFHAKWNSENFGGSVDVRQFQWDFWKDGVLDIQNENEKVFVYMNNRPDEYSADTIEMCHEKIIYFYKIADMYKDSIYEQILRQATDKSEMTVLIGLDAIQKYRCRNFLKLWNIISWEHQRTASDRWPTRDVLHETEATITRNVGEFLNVVYDFSK